MDDPALERLLQLVDDPAPDPAEFKSALRSELQKTLDRGVPSGAIDDDRLVDGEVITLEPSEIRPPRRVSRLVAAAAATVLIVAVGIGLFMRDGGSPDMRVVDPAVSSSTEPAPPASSTAPSIESACATYVETAPTVAALERFAEVAATSGSTLEQPAQDPPDLDAAAEALARLGTSLADTQLVDPSGVRSLQLAAGAMTQAATELDAGDRDSATQSVRFALEELRGLGDPPDATLLPGCGFLE